MPEHVLVHISADMILEFSYFGTKIILSYFSCRKQTGLSICLTLGVTTLASTKEMKRVLSYQFNVGALVWIDKASMYLSTALVLLTALYMHLISPSVNSEAISG